MVVSRLPRLLDDLPDRAAAEERRQAVAQELLELRPLEQRLGYRFHRTALLRVALTHGSWAKEHPEQGWPGNATLEFFGDAVLGLLAADAIWRRFPDLAEGQLTRLRAAVVSALSLADAARRVELGPWLFLSRGQVVQGGRDHAGTLADSIEAILGASFLDAREAGEYPLDGVERVFESLFGDRVGELEPHHGLHPKARLQHWAQARYRVAPVYVRVGNRPDPGAPHWEVQAELHHADGRNEPLGRGEGRSLRRAERAAAEDALRRLEDA